MNSARNQFIFTLNLINLKIHKNPLYFSVWNIIELRPTINTLRHKAILYRIHSEVFLVVIIKLSVGRIMWVSGEYKGTSQDHKVSNKNNIVKKYSLSRSWEASQDLKINLMAE